MSIRRSATVTPELPITGDRFKDPFLRWSDYFNNIDNSSNIRYMIEHHHDHPNNQERPPIRHETKHETKNISNTETNYCTSFSEVKFSTVVDYGPVLVSRPLDLKFIHLPNLSDTIPEIPSLITNATKIIDERIVAIISRSHNRLYSIRAEYKPLSTRISSNS